MPLSVAALMFSSAMRETRRKKASLLTACDATDEMTVLRSDALRELGAVLKLGSFDTASNTTGTSL